MIKEISFKNYKAFDSGSIEIKPITILLGANSVGKSSILQLLLMLQQTSETEKYKSALKLHGDFVSMGEPINLIKDQDNSKVLNLSFRFVSEDLLKLLVTNAMKQLSALISELLSYLQPLIPECEPSFFLKYVPNLTEPIRNIPMMSFSIDSKDQLMDIIAYLNKANQQIHSTKDLKELLIGNNWLYGNYPFFYMLSYVDELERIYDLLVSFKTVTNNEFTISFDFMNFESKKDNILKVTSITLNHQDKCILKLMMQLDNKNESYNSFKLISDFFNKELINESINKEFSRNIDFDSTIFSLFYNHDKFYYPEGDKPTSYFTQIIFKIFSTAIRSVKACFDRNMINYVSPLRAFPKRYYFLDKASINTHLDTFNGDSLTEILKDDELVRTRVNKWLSNFNLSVDVDTLQDIIHKIKVKQNDLLLDITDVGFGLSQVLPVIVQGFLSFKNSLTIIEHPEIHLHPKMQADLADLFIDIAFRKRNKINIPSKYLLIETHSEYILRRLRRRMAENQKISPADVAIYYFNPRGDSVTGTIEKKDINATGAFDYPKDFYDGELLNDNIEFIKRQL